LGSFVDTIVISRFKIQISKFWKCLLFPLDVIVKYGISIVEKLI